MSSTCLEDEILEEYNKECGDETLNESETILEEDVENTTLSTELELEQENLNQRIYNGSKLDGGFFGSILHTFNKNTFSDLKKQISTENAFISQDVHMQKDNECWSNSVASIWQATQRRNKESGIIIHQDKVDDLHRDWKIERGNGGDSFEVLKLECEIRNREVKDSGNEVKQVYNFEKLTADQCDKVANIIANHKRPLLARFKITRGGLRYRLGTVCQHRNKILNAKSVKYLNQRNDYKKDRHDTDKEEDDNEMVSHAVCVTGVNVSGKYFKIKNSWGSDFGDNGYFRVSFEAIKLMDFEFADITLKNESSL